MPRKPKHIRIHCQFYDWRLFQRKENKVWYGDGRESAQSLGKFSLRTRNKEEAIKRLRVLDRCCAEDQGLVPRSEAGNVMRTLTIKDGRKRFDDHNARPRMVGGTKRSTQKKYRSILDKFEIFVEEKRITDWHDITKETLTDYATHLTEDGYAYKTIHGEITTLKIAFKWLSSEGHIDREPINLKLKKADCQRAYCYSTAEVAAMRDHCKASKGLTWLLNVITALACTGVRIGELVSLKWSDIKFDDRTLSIVDESGYANQSDDSRSTKNGRSRHIPIQQELLNVFRSMPRKDVYVFHGPLGGRLKSDTVRTHLIRHVINKLVKRFPKQFPGEKSFEDGRLHSFRHYFCSRCANEGIAERIVMEWLGHSDSEMVKHYYHLSDEESRRKMDQLNLLGESGGCSATSEEQNT